MLGAILGRMNDDLRVNDAIALPRAELTWRFSRSGGPGGQSVNTTDSRVELRFDLAATSALPEPLRARALDRLAGRLVGGTTVMVVADEHRSQSQNRRAAEARLVALLAAAIAAPPRARRRTRPSRAAIERRLESKRRRSQTKRDRRDPDD
jgi:ribosome-associated protein